MKIALSLETVASGRLGQVSQYLQNIFERVKDFSSERVTVRIFIKDSLFALPADLEKTPIICVGPGTGVVPFIGFM